MYRMAVIGEPWSVWAFAGLGLSVFPAEKKDEVLQILESMDNDYAMVFVTEIFAEVIEERNAQHALKDKKRFPIVCLIPGHKGSRNAGQKLIKEVVRKAVGFEME